MCYYLLTRKFFSSPRRLCILIMYEPYSYVLYVGSIFLFLHPFFYFLVSVPLFYTMLTQFLYSNYIYLYTFSLPQVLFRFMFYCETRDFSFHLFFASLSCSVKVYVKLCILFIVGVSFRVAPPFIVGQIKPDRLKINKEGICRNTALRKLEQVKFTPEQATKAQRGSRGITLLFL